jgi:hypothetical protein
MQTPHPQWLNSGAIILASIGLSEDGRADLTEPERQEIISIAEELHRRAGWEAPPDVLRLAVLAGVRLYELPPREGTILGADAASYPAHPCIEARCLLAAHALAGACLLQHALPLRFVGVWMLAAELLVPAWAARAGPTLGAPPWLLGLRRRATSAA